MLNRIIITGRLCADPELRQTRTGVPFCSIRIACTRDFKREGEEKPGTDFFDATAWRGTGEFISRNFTKGRAITLDGRMESRDWTEKESGKKRTSYEINVDNAYFADSKPADAQAPGGYPGEAPGGYPDGAYGAPGGYPSGAYTAPGGPQAPAGQVPDNFTPDF